MFNHAPSRRRPRAAARLASGLALSLLCAVACAARPAWEARLDGEVRFYQQTELGVIVAGTERSLYALDAETGEPLWRRKGARFEETDVAPVPGTDFALLAFEG